MSASTDVPPVGAAPARDLRLPNLVVVGAMKSGTGSLHEYLDLHPEVGMSRPKELNFFVDQAGGTWHRGLDWYASHWAAGTRVRGESSPNYSKAPVFPGVPARMAATVPDARLIYVVRDPIERIASHWLHGVLKGRETRPLAEAVAEPEGNPYVIPSRYHFQLSQFLAHYPEERILVLDLDELAGQPADAMRRVFAFVGVDASFTSPAIGRRHHRSALKSPPTAVGRAVQAVAPRRVWSALRLLPPTRRLLLRPLPPTELPDEVRDRLAAALADDVARLRSATGLQFAGWSL